MVYFLCMLFFRSRCWEVPVEQPGLSTTRSSPQRRTRNMLGTKPQCFFLNAGATGELLMEHHREMNAGWEMQWTWEMHMNVSWEVKVYSPETQQKTCKSMKSWPWSGFSFSYLSFRFWSANFFRGCALIAEHKMLPARASSSTESSARSLTKWLGLVMPEGREVQITWCILMYDVWICMIHTHIVIQESCIYIYIETYCCVFLYSLVMFIFPLCRTQGKNKHH